jgi:glycine hydroxymethyltransferase
MYSSGVRLGSPACTTRGFKEAEFREVARLIAEVVDALAVHGPDGAGEVEQKVRRDVLALTSRFPIYN